MIVLQLMKRYSHCNIHVYTFNKNNQCYFLHFSLYLKLNSDRKVQVV